MKKYRVLLTRDYVVEINAKNKNEAKEYAESIIKGRNHPVTRMEFVFSVLGLDPEHFLPIYSKWSAEGCPPFEHICPLHRLRFNNRTFLLCFYLVWLDLA